MGKQVQLVGFQYPDVVRVAVKGKLYVYETSEYWARKAIVQMRFGDGWRGVAILKKNGKVVNHGARLEEVR